MLNRKHCCCVTSPPCNVTIHVTGCGGLALRGATVKVWTNSGKTVLIASGTTNASGDVTLDLVSVGTGWIEILGVTRFNDINQSFGWSCSRTYSFAMTVATGFACVGGCAWPIKNVLQLTDSVYGAFTLTRSGSIWLSGPGFPNGINIGFPGCRGCPAATVNILFSFDAGWNVQYSHGLPLLCPSVSGTTWTTPGSKVCSTQTCYIPGVSAFLAVWTWNHLDGVLYCSDPTWTITE